MKWILLAWVWSGGGTGGISAEFESRKACVIAGSTLVNASLIRHKFYDPKKGASFVCVQKGGSQ